MESNGANNQTELLQQILKTEQTQLRYTRLRFWLTLAGVVLGLIALIAMFVGMNYLKGQIESVTAAVTETSQKVNEVADQLNAIDFAALEQAIHELATSATDLIRSLETGLSGLKSVMDNAEAAMKNLSGVDIDGLNKGIEQLNAVLKPLSDFFSVFGR